jgi:hypothetical protein
MQSSTPFGLALAFVCALISTPAQAQGFDFGNPFQGMSFGFPGSQGMTNPAQQRQPQGRSTGRGVGTRYGLPPVATSSVDLNIVEAGSTCPMGGGGGGCGGGGFPGGPGTEGQQQEIPPQPPNTMAVVNSHNGQFMGWKTFDESWEDFFSGSSGHLLPGNELEGRYILYQMGLGPNPMG